MTFYLKYIRPIWDNPVTRAIAAAIATFGVLALYTLRQQAVGRAEAEQDRKVQDAKRLEEIRAASEDAVRDANTVRVNSGSYDDNRLPAQPAPAHHYRDTVADSDGNDGA